MGPLGVERLVTLEVPDPGLVALRAVKRGLGGAGPPLVVQDDVAVRIAPVLGHSGHRPPGATGRHHQGIGTHVGPGRRYHHDRERDGGSVGLAPIGRDPDPAAPGTVGGTARARPSRCDWVERRRPLGGRRGVPRAVAGLA